MKKTYVTPEVEYINFYSEETMTGSDPTSGDINIENGENGEDWD